MKLSNLALWERVRHLRSGWFVGWACGGFSSIPITQFIAMYYPLCRICDLCTMLSRRGHTNF
jgi:hypothetical protein